MFKEKAEPTHRQIIQMTTGMLETAIKNQELGNIEPPFTNRQIKQMKSELKKRRK